MEGRWVCSTKRAIFSASVTLPPALRRQRKNVNELQPPSMVANSFLSSLHHHQQFPHQQRDHTLQDQRPVGTYLVVYFNRLSMQSRSANVRRTSRVNVEGTTSTKVRTLRRRATLHFDCILGERDEFRPILVTQGEVSTPSKGGARTHTPDSEVQRLPQKNR